MDDLISRQAVLDYIDSMPSELTADGRRMIRRIRLIEYVQDSIPPVQPEQKTGRWVETNNPNYSPFDSRTEPYNAICSECFYTSTHKFNYCPNCGARMDGETECD